MTDTEIYNVIKQRIIEKRIMESPENPIVIPKVTPKVPPRYKKVDFLTKIWSESCFNECILLDIETTGLSPYQNNIIEIAAIRYRKGVECEKFFTLIKPPEKISSRITKITGITNEMVEQCPPIEDVIHNFFGFIQDSILVAYNASFDLNFLHQNASKHNLMITNNVIDALQVCRKLYPDFENHKLCTVCDNFNIDLTNAHRARNDVRATAKVLFNCYEKYNSSPANIRTRRKICY
jgi:DNA polymerase III epsilon subunit family exonuclease